MVAPETPLDEGTQSPLQVGEILVGKYRVERQIGRGGMGIVLAATHLQLEHLVAIKVLRRDLLEDDKALHRLFSEARAAAKIRSEHVARVLDVGTLDNGSPFIVMEYLEGEDLADLLDRQGALEVTQAVRFLLQSCEALAEVHAAEMVHRDLKPGNLFVAKLPDGSASLKIVDFGISKHIGGSARNQAATTSAQVLGSPYYMPPEQMRAEPVDERSDIWSLGAILFEMLTGRPPFLGETLPEVYAGVLSGSVPSLESLRPGIPHALDDIVQRCLDKDPAQRFCDVADLAEALAPFGGPASAHSVERITRILTNPELFRARTSHAPRAPVGVEPQLSSGTARGGIAVEPKLVLTPNRITPSRVVDAGGADFSNAAPLNPALVTPAIASQARRAPTSSEFGPLSATGSLEGLEPPTATRRSRVLWAAAALVVLVGAGAFSLWGGSGQPTAQSAATPLPLPQPAADTAPSVGGGVEPAPAPAREAPGSPELQTEKQGLRPAPARAPVISVDAARAPSTKGAVRASAEKPSDVKPKGKQPPGKIAPSSVAVQGPARSESRAEARSASESGAPADTDPASKRSGNTGREEDPWNPSSFGDRH